MIKDIGFKYGTDKATRPERGYISNVYEPLFKPVRDKNIKILEIGADMGASHKLWSEYFKNGQVYCLDPFFTPGTENVKQELENDFDVITHTGNQLTREDNLEIAKMANYEFDFIIDDASHVADGVMTSFGVLFPYLKSGGYYIVEDIATIKRRSKSLSKVNHWGKSLNGQNCELFIEHQEEEIITDSLASYDVTGKFNSKILNEKEKTYLEKNIEDYNVFVDIVQIKKI
jgi:hypothetical protein